MIGIGAAQFAQQECISSNALRKFTKSVSETAAAVVGYSTQSFVFTTMQVDSALEKRTDVFWGEFNDNEKASAVVRSHVSELSQADQTALSSHITTGTSTWRIIQLELDNGHQDRIALQLDPKEDLNLTQNYLSHVWPLLREDCLSEVMSQTATKQVKTCDWALLDKLHVALIILDSDGLMYRLNHLGRRILDEADVLCRGKGGIFATNRQDTTAFRGALSECANSKNPKAADQVVFIASKEDGHRVPVSMSRYYYNGEPTRFVVATLPVAPSRQRIETLAQQLGLSSSEARVAALIQRGMSNREAAVIAGLKEQTFNTYAKRVLNKLDVSCRAEMARLLTWQASGGRMT